MSFALHPQLTRDCHHLGDLTLCRLLLMDDARFPWCILVPRRDGLRELHDLAGDDRSALFDELDAVSRALQHTVDAHKINVAALGNQVPQLHVHVIARQQDDAAWPGPVWGQGPAEPYAPGVLDGRVTALCRALGNRLEPR